MGLCTVPTGIEGSGEGSCGTRQLVKTKRDLEGNAIEVLIFAI